MVIGDWSLVIGHWSLVIGINFLPAPCNLSPVTFSLTFNQTLHRSLKKFPTSDHNKS
ncbi:hypothetical protein ANA_C11570 [Anabaena sp. 90]|nr:hypothetical protein ANA_C11570 [Anabaena sp. 90]